MLEFEAEYSCAGECQHRTRNISNERTSEELISAPSISSWCALSGFADMIAICSGVWPFYECTEALEPWKFSI